MSVIRYIVKDVFINIGHPIQCMCGFGDECCYMRGLLGFLVLSLVSKKPMHGQEIASELAKRKGEKPSPGTIYPALKALRDAGFLSELKEGKTITYSLTSRGEKALELSKKKFTRTFFGVIR
jgi:PadR family transcriptional regulator, regulatory protein PadR